MRTVHLPSPAKIFGAFWPAAELGRRPRPADFFVAGGGAGWWFFPAPGSRNLMKTFLRSKSSKNGRFSCYRIDAAVLAAEAILPWWRSVTRSVNGQRGAVRANQGDFPGAVRADTWAWLSLVQIHAESRPAWIRITPSKQLNAVPSARNGSRNRLALKQVQVFGQAGEGICG